MEFGKVNDLNGIDFNLPPTPAYTEARLGTQTSTPKPQIFVGCPVWANKAWLGKWYPLHTQERNFLREYARQFNTIELNVTHYQIPHQDTVLRWREAVPPHFRFAPKFPQDISHHRLWTGNYAPATQVFVHHIRLLGDRLGRCFLQLPPTCVPTELPRIEAFLASLPPDFEMAVEFRHQAWFKGDALLRAAECLAHHRVAAVMTDVAGRRDVLHLHLPIPVLMLRFVGNDLHLSDYTRIEAWVGRIAEWLNKGLETVYFFAHEPNNDLAPDLAKFFVQQLNAATGLGIAEPSKVHSPIQGNLFGE